MPRIRSLLLIWYISSCGPRPVDDLVLPGDAIVYAAPSSAAQVLDTLPAGLSVINLGEEAGWYHVCWQGIRGWVRLEAAEPLLTTPLDEGILAEGHTDTILAELAPDGGESIYLSIQQLRPWFVRDSQQYAGFYEGLPGEPFALLIVNFAPRLALILRASSFDAETMEIMESEQVLKGDYYLKGNLILASEEADAPPFRRAEFIQYQAKRGLLIEEAPGKFYLLWYRELAS